ncbi:MAG: hypothetical protein M3Y77_09685 [Actinomycetota bacterium]|nr:hypothetical protein [Actinomycetota bacterium]
MLDSGAGPLNYDAFLETVTDPVQFPALTAARSVFADDEEDFYTTEFEFGLSVYSAASHNW